MPSVSKYATTASVSTAKAVGWGTTAVQRGEADAMTASSSTSTQAHSAAEAVDLSTPREMQDPTVQARSKAPPTGNKSRSSMPASSSTSQAAGKRAPRDALPTWRLVEIFKAVPKGTQPDMKALQAQVSYKSELYMHSSRSRAAAPYTDRCTRRSREPLADILQCGHYKISHWTSLWYQYRNRYERFRNMTPSDTGEDDAHVYGDENHEDHEDDRDEDDDVDADDSEGSDYGAEGGSMRNSPRPAIGTRLVKKRNPMPLAQLVDIFSSVPESERPDYDELAEKVCFCSAFSFSPTGLLASIGADVITVPLLSALDLVSSMVQVQASHASI